VFTAQSGEIILTAWCRPWTVRILCVRHAAQSFAKQFFGDSYPDVSVVVAAAKNLPLCVRRLMGLFFRHGSPTFRSKAALISCFLKSVIRQPHNTIYVNIPSVVLSVKQKLFGP
jgi:hypothetical protein